MLNTVYYMPAGAGQGQPGDGKLFQQSFTSIKNGASYYCKKKKKAKTTTEVNATQTFGVLASTALPQRYHYHNLPYTLVDHNAHHIGPVSINIKQNNDHTLK